MRRVWSFDLVIGLMRGCLDASEVVEMGGFGQLLALALTVQPGKDVGVDAVPAPEREVSACLLVQLSM